MIFTEFRFLVFFLVVFAVYWSVGNLVFRKTWLLAASYLFYAAWDWRFLSLILISTAVDYVVGLKLEDSPSKKVWICLSMVVNLGLLGFFKYFNFFLDSGGLFLGWLGLPIEPRILDIVLPVGISFYTFQTMSYSLDIYFGKLKPTRNLLDLALFVGFFPQLVAGPIVRARDFLPQLLEHKLFSDVRVRWALILFLVGFIKKMCISDALISGLADPVFADPAKYNGLGLFLGVLCYAVQIYCDFSGYSDMAIATAGLLGFKLCDNFQWPYLATNITAFWRRWHMSLSSWLRDYLYIPLGGNRGGEWFTCRNLMLTMLLGGLWHGAGWNFVIWGGLHGLALIVHKYWHRLAGERFGMARAALGLPLTFYFVCVCWIFFRAESFESAMIILRGFVLFDGGGTRAVAPNLVYLLPVLALAHVLASRRVAAPFFERLPAWGFAVAYGVLAALVLPFTVADAKPFIYFQF